MRRSSYGYEGSEIAYEIFNLLILTEITRFHERLQDFRRDFEISVEISQFHKISIEIS